MSSDTSTYLVAGDIGGTNSRLGLYHHPNVAAGEDSIPNQLCYKEYLNEKYLLEDEDEAPESLFERTILHNFLQDYWSEQSLSQDDDAIESVSIVVCLAIAGPVQNNAVQTSRLKALEINGNHLVERCQTSQDPLLKYIKECYILNDFVAQGYGCLTLTPDELVELIPGSHEKKHPCGPIVCIGAGTGLGTCFLTASKSFSRGSNNNNNHPSFYSCLPSEFGQVEWTPRSDDDVKVWRYLQMKLHSPDRVSLEEVVSGTGLASCYECFAMKYFDKVQPSIEEQFETAGDMKGKVVADNVDACEVCHRAMTTVMSSYGAATSSCAMTFLPTGGIYLTGGLAPKHYEKWILPQDDDDNDDDDGSSCFLRAYWDKGRASSLLEDIPLFLVQCPDMGLRGAVRYAQMIMQLQT